MAPMMPGAPAARDGDTLLDKCRPVLGDWMELARMTAKKVIGLVLVLFLGFWMFQDPHGFAETAKTLGDGTWTALSTVFSGVIRFIGELS
jgi:hypothetical protein